MSEEKRAVDWTAIRADYERGASLRALSAKYGVSKSLIGKRKYQERWTEWTGTRGHVDTIHAATDSEGTPKKRALSDKEQFLEAFAEHGIVTRAAEAAGIDRRTVYKWLEHDAVFALAFNQAKESAKDIVRAEIYQRAVKGWDEEVYQFGLLAGTVHKYSDTLLIFHAKALMPEYRDKQQIDMNTQATTQDARALQETVLQALAAYPDARIAVAEALMEKSREQH